MTATEQSPTTESQALETLANAGANPAPEQAAPPKVEPASTKAAPEPEVAYAFKGPDGKDLPPTPMLDAFTGIVRDLKLAPDAANALLLKIDEAEAKEIARLRAESEKAAKADPDIGGAHWETSLAAARSAQGRYGGKEFVEAMDRTGLNGNALFIKAWKAVATRVAPDQVHKGETGPQKRALTLEEKLYGVSA